MRMPIESAPTVIPADPSIILWVFFWFAMVVTIWFGFGLLYHWIRYGFMYPLVWVMMPAYIIGVLVFVGAMLGGISVV